MTAHPSLDRPLVVVLIAWPMRTTGTPAPARDLCVGPLAGDAISYAEALADQWWVLCAEHGAVRPEQVLDPPARTLADLTGPQLLTWRNQVAATVRLLDDPARPHCAAIGVQSRSTAPLELWLQLGGRACLVLLGPDDHLAAVRPAFADLRGLQVAEPGAELNTGRQRAGHVSRGPRPSQPRPATHALTGRRPA